ncbi:phage antirepressor KilAC domain-containing protein [Fusobacterium pseudoperiodonticum]|uniref:phage antirepressor KilAC domain-containing protein n=1 Tax=Fusobacterium pseudoperiodonticum TaxID=2663009 RepID=UPI001884B769|nr:phage antirepressor KilAC domain-containing protein [Fusobacterium pseudoperiodonticum]
MMNDLIKIEIKDNQQLVSGRDLHSFLEIKTPYTQWIERMIEYGFIENTDYILVSQKSESSNITGVKVIQEHFMTIAMAKEISMIQRNEKGKLARQYFIKCEEAWNSSEMILARANQIQAKMIEDSTKKIQLLETKIEEMQPKADFYDDVADSTNTCDMQTVAKTLNFKGVGRNTLFEILRDSKILQYDNIPYQKYVDRGWFRLIETKYHDKKTSEPRINFKTVVFQKGIEKISNLLKELGYQKVI